MATKRKTEVRDSDDEMIQAGIDQDSESPEWTVGDFEKARSAAEVMPQIVKSYKAGTLKRRPRGLQKEPTKEHISIRIDQDVVKFYRKKGRGWQAQLNEDLRKVTGLEKNHQ